MAVNEDLIERQIEALGISRYEALQMMVEDEKIDKLSRTSDIDSDLTKEQKENAKEARQMDHRTVYKFDTSKRVKKEDNAKRFLINAISEALEGADCGEVAITNVEREINFTYNKTKYKLILSAPRS